MLAKSQKISERRISFTDSSALGFVSALVIVLLMIGGVAGFYLLFQKYWAAFNYTRGALAFGTENNLSKAESGFSNAVRFDEQDLYYRALAEVGLVRLSQVLDALANPQADQQVLLNQFQNILAQTIAYAQRAKELNSQDPLNHELLGRIYEAIVPLNITGSREMSLELYKVVAELSKNDPRPLLASARVELQTNNMQPAKEFLTRAVQMKGDYTPALFLLAQIEARQGNTQAAILQTEQARLFAPNDIGILFQLGLLYYQNGNFDQAIPVLERCVILSQNYSNARYFLGLAYDKKDRKSDAIAQFKVITELNPGNEEVNTILSNLRAGRAALSHLSPPAPQPENRDEPPVKDENSVIREQP
jgi:tetratricopeptide (TPR) repeat protein